MSIKLKLIGSIALLAVSLTGLGASGFIAQTLTTEMTRTIVSDGVVGLGELTRINDMYSNIVRDVQGVVLGELPFADGQASVAESLGNIDTDWAGYLASPMSAESAAIVEIAKQRMSAAEPSIAALGQLLADQDLPGLTGYTKAELGETMESIASQFDQLAEIQVAKAQTDFADAQSLSSLAMWVMSGIALLSFFLLAFALYVVLRSVIGPMHRMERAMRHLAEGNLTTDVPYARQADEIGKMAAAVLVFKENGLRVARMTEAEAATAATSKADRSAMMEKLRAEFGMVVDAAISGDLSKRVASNFADPELNNLAGGVNRLVETVDRGITETGSVLNALAQTNLTKRVTGTYEGAFEQLKRDANAVADRLGEIVGQLRETSGALKTATGEILAGANDLSERTTRQAAAIEETSAAMEQLASTVNGNAKRAEQASAKARSVSADAELGGQVMQRANEAMVRISASSGKISNIIGVIDDIAFQTNLLALNASVEAARAGDAGKGFAVVAIEVRRLAQSAAQASSEVKALIEQSANEVQGGSKLVSDATERLAAMLAGVRENSALIDGIAQASGEQSSAIAEVSSAVRQMDEMTQHNAALVEETNAAIEQTEAQASDLDRIVDVFVVAGPTATAGRAPRQVAQFGAVGLRRANG